MASVQNPKGHICGGFLVSKDYVMTAAHCDKKALSVVLGTHDLRRINEQTMRYNVKKCKHPDYNNRTLENDIMLLKLISKPSIKNGTRGKIKPVRIPAGPMMLTEKTKFKVTGWGALRTGGPSVDELYVVGVRFVDRKTCESLWGATLPLNTICAGGYRTKKGFCQGDSGGPLLFADQLAVGVVSFNRKSTTRCDCPEFPNVYTDVSKYLPWITNILNKNTC